MIGWRRGNAELTYRRFFDITNLAAVRVEDPTVFAATHGEVLRWVADGDVTGLRVDHPDGLADPGGYFRRLRESAPDAWIVVEKILHPGEPLPQSWPVDGTTGYDALREIAGVFVDPAAEPGFTALATELGVKTGYHRVEADGPAPGHRPHPGGRGPPDRGAAARRRRRAGRGTPSPRP